MTTRPVTVNVPDDLYDRLKQRATVSHRSVEDEVVATLAASDTIPADWEAALTQLGVLDDQAVWQAARTRLSPRAVRRLESLNYKCQREGLNDAELTEQAQLVHEYERIMLLRAHAAVVLKERGHDVNVLLKRR